MQAVLAILIYLAAFLAVILAVHAAAQLIFASGDRRQRTNRRLTMLATGMEPQEVYRALIRRSAQRFGSGPLRSYYDRLCIQCQQAGIESNPLHILFWVSGASCLLWLLSLSLAHAASFSGMMLIL